jgi:hypothetical protein
MRTEKPIEFDAPTPASPLMLGRKPAK